MVLDDNISLAGNNVEDNLSDLIDIAENTKNYELNKDDDQNVITASGTTLPKNSNSGDLSQDSQYSSQITPSTKIMKLLHLQRL